MKQELLIAEPQTGAAAPTPMALIQIAMTQGAGVETLERLMALQERWQANEARMAYNAAMTAFKSNPPQINKNQTVDYGEGSKRTTYKHATLDHVTDAITGALSAVGIGHRWTVRQDNDAITVTCVLTHSQGHFEETSLTAKADNSGSKNNIQAIGSAVTYLQRYTLLAATGLAAGGQDDDGRASGLPADIVAEQIEWINNSRDIAELQRIYTAAYKLAAEKRDPKAMKEIIRAKDERKRELAA